MEKALRAYGEVLRLIRKLPKDTRPYYSKYARENFVNYREIEAGDLQELLSRTYRHCVWVLQKYSVEESAARRLKEICLTSGWGRQTLDDLGVWGGPQDRCGHECIIRGM
ncbi:hypothetical protein V2J09_018392 [Rumex salicifolius]